MAVALEAGADDITEESDYFKVVCAPTELQKLRNALSEAGITPEDARIAMEPNATMSLDREGSEKVIRLMEALDEADDVQEVYSNFDIPDELMAELDA